MGKLLDLCKGNIIFCHVDCFCLQEEMEDEGEVFCDPFSEATASALCRRYDNCLGVATDLYS